MSNFHFSIHLPSDNLPQFGSSPLETAEINAKRSELNMSRVIVVEIDVSDITTYGAGLARVEVSSPLANIAETVQHLYHALKSLNAYAWRCLFSDLWETETQSEISWMRTMKIAGQSINFFRPGARKNYGFIDPNLLLLHDKEGLPTVIKINSKKEGTRFSINDGFLTGLRNPQKK